MKTSEITAIFDADLARVWEAVTNNADCGWRSDLSGIEITGENTFTEFANNGFPTYFTITEKREHELYELDIDNKNFFGHWTGKFRALEGGGDGSDVYGVAARQKSADEGACRSVYERKKISAALRRGFKRKAERG